MEVGAQEQEVKVCFCTSQFVSFQCSIWYTFFLWPCHATRGIIVPSPEIEPTPPVLKVQNLNHWTLRQVPRLVHFFKISLIYSKKHGYQSCGKCMGMKEVTSRHLEGHGESPGPPPTSLPTPSLSTEMGALCSALASRGCLHLLRHLHSQALPHCAQVRPTEGALPGWEGAVGVASPDRMFVPRTSLSRDLVTS